MSDPVRTLKPPGGHPPPRTAGLPDGTTLDLEALAREIARRYLARYPDEQARYGDAGAAWCVHDNQHLLNWATLEACGFGSMDDDVSWLAGVLDRRGFPLDRLAHDLDLAADVVTEQEIPAAPRLSEALRRSAGMVRERLAPHPDPAPA